MSGFARQLQEALQEYADWLPDELELLPVSRRSRLEEAVARLNCAKTSLARARAYAEEQFRKAGKNLDEVIPDFDANYEMIRKKCATALDVPRIQMPVIEPQDMKTFDERLKKGHIDIFQPYAKGKLETPPSMTKAKGEEWVTLGVKDGSPKDDVIKGKWTSAAVKTLKPTQSQIWLDKLVGNIIKFGKPGAGSSLLKQTVITSKEGYILDGHHRFGQAMLVDPNLKLKVLHIPLPIDLLLKIGRTYGGAIGNRPKA